LEDMENSKAPGTIKAYRQVYNQYGGFLGRKKPTIENAEDFIKELEAKPASLNFYMMAIRTYFRENDIDIPIKKLKTISGINNIKEDKYVTRKEVDTLHKCANNLRDKVIVRMLYHAGLRATELINMNVGDLDLANERITVDGLKGSHRRRRVRFIRPELVIPTVRAYLQQKGIDSVHLSKEQKEEPFILNKNKKRIAYSGLRKVVNNLGTAIGKDDFTPHWLRHGFVVWNKVHGVQPEITAMQIGDTVETTTRIYSHYNESDIDRVYDEIQGKIKEDEPSVRNPIDEVEELKIINIRMEERINKLEKAFELFAKGREWEKEKAG